MKKRTKERGQALIVVALALIALVGIVGLVIDGGSIFLDRRKAQNAADSAALASALVRIRGESDWVGAALTSALNNGYNNDGVTNSVQVYSPPINGPLEGNVEYIQVIISSNVNTFLLRLIGTSQYTNIVNATARTKSAELKSLVNGMALVSLAPESNCSTNKAFWLHGNVLFDITGGGVFVNSNNQTCALIQNGNSGITVKGGNGIDVVGGARIEKPQMFSPSITVGVGPAAYPPFFMPAIACEEDAKVSEDGTSMTPGNWEDEFPPHGVTHLEEGVYCLENGLKVEGALTGTGVLFFVKDGDVHVNSSANMQISAPTTGDNAGLLIYLPMENDNSVILDASPSTFIGTILAPASPISIKGGSSQIFQSQIIGYTVDAEGGNIVIRYDPAQNFKALTMPEVQLSE
jgi:Flp pilus assembly protein TadG